MEANFITRGESLFFIFYTLPTVWLLTYSLAKQIENLEGPHHELHNLKILMIILRASLLAIAVAILIFNVLNWLGLSMANGFLHTLPYGVSTMLNIAALIMALQWWNFGNRR